MSWFLSSVPHTVAAKAQSPPSFDLQAWPHSKSADIYQALGIPLGLSASTHGLTRLFLKTILGGGAKWDHRP